MKYVIKKVEEYYYRIPIEREDEFDELADIDSGYNINDWCGSDFVSRNFNKYLIEEEEFIVVEKDGIYYHIPESLNNNFQKYIELSEKKELMRILNTLRILFNKYIISVE